MTKSEIEFLISILEKRMNETEGAISRFVIWQEIKSLRYELELLQDQSHCFY